MELVQSSHSATFIEKGAKQLLLKLLGRLGHGQLVLQDGGERHSFGVAGTDLQAELLVQDPAFYRRLLLGGSIAAGETWVEGLWTSPDPVALVRLLARNMALLDNLEQRLGWLSFPFNKARHWLNRNTLTGSRSNIAAHYDLGNTLYQGFLDSHMQYSSAIYPSAEASLEEGQQAKLRTICERLALSPTDHLLEIGTGWGGLAVYAARHYGCKVTTTTISQAQHDYAKGWIAKEGLADRITLLQVD
ncbi:MAG: SAM-dependent methyltransferase, partial [Aeromonas sp.]